MASERRTPTTVRRDQDLVIDLRDGAAEIAILPDVEVVLARRWFLLSILGALNLLDLVTTRLVIEAGGQEANPLMAPIIHHPVAPAAVKTVGFVVVALVLRACPPRSAIVDRSLAAVTAIYSIVVGWNLLNLLLHS
jgi:Domain of unknown function (DUF5658)